MCQHLLDKNFYRDKKGYIDKEKGDYKCYYPFLDYSPELIGMRYGRIHKIPTMFNLAFLANDKNKQDYDA